MHRLSHIFQTHLLIELNIVSADDIYLYDEKGKRFVDFESGIWCASLGHNHPCITKCITAQLDRACHLAPGLTGGIADDAAGALLKHTPIENGKAVFLSSGSEAMTLSLLLATGYTRRTGLIAFTGSYLGAYIVNSPHGDGRHWNWIDIDICRQCDEDECHSSCRQLAGIDLDHIAAFVFEPVFASGGIILPPKKAIEGISREVQRAGGLVVADEVTTGLARTGKWLGIGHYDLKPDLIVFGKTLGNGYPVSALVIARPIADSMEKRNFYYVQSHQNDPLGCAVAKEVISVLESSDYIARARSRGNYLKECLQRIQARHSLISDIRGLGLMVGLELREDDSGRGPMVERIARNMRERGYIIGFKPNLSLLRFLPPYTIGERDISDMCRNLDEVLLEAV